MTFATRACVATMLWLSFLPPLIPLLVFAVAAVTPVVSAAGSVVEVAAHTATVSGDGYDSATMFQLGMFLRVQRPALTVLRPARTPLRLVRIKIYLKLFFFYIYFLLLRFQNCKLLVDLCPVFHRSPAKLCPDLVTFACRVAPGFLSFTR